MLQNQQMTQLDVKEHSVYEFLVSHIIRGKTESQLRNNLYKSKRICFPSYNLQMKLFNLFSMAKFGFLDTIL